MIPHEPSCRCAQCHSIRWLSHVRRVFSPMPLHLRVGPDGYSAPEPTEEADYDAAFLRSLGIKP